MSDFPPLGVMYGVMGRDIFCPCLVFVKYEVAHGKQVFVAKFL